MQKQNQTPPDKLKLRQQLWQRGRTVAGSILLLPDSFENKFRSNEIVERTPLVFFFCFFLAFSQFWFNFNQGASRLWKDLLSFIWAISTLTCCHCLTEIVAHRQLSNNVGSSFSWRSVCSPPPMLPPRACVYTAVWKWGRWALCSCLWETLEFKEVRKASPLNPATHKFYWNINIGSH